MNIHVDLSMKLALVIFGLATVALALATAPLSAQEAAAAGKVGLELNKLEQVDDACRIYFVLRNRKTAYDSFKLDVVLFDAGGVVTRRVAVQTGPLRAQRPTVKLFDVQDLSCDDIGSMLVNDVLECRPADAAADCLAHLEVRSRADVEILR